MNKRFGSNIGSVNLEGLAPVSEGNEVVEDKPTNDETLEITDETVAELSITDESDLDDADDGNTVDEVDEEDYDPLAPVQEVQEEEVQEEVQEEVHEDQVDETLTLNPSDENSHTVVEEKELTDEDLLNALNTKYGKEAESLDSLFEVEDRYSDPELDELLEWKKRTGRSITDFPKYTRDIDSISDIDVIREVTANKYPALNAEEIEFKVQAYLPSSDDTPEDIMAKNIKIKTDAADYRQDLEKDKLVFNTAHQAEAKLTPEQLQTLDLGKQVEKQRIEAAKAKEAYTSSLNEGISKTTSLDVNIGKLKGKFNVSDSTKEGLSDFINTMPHWYNEDGTPNVQNIVSDAIKLKEFDKLMELSYKQGQSAKIKELNNVDTSGPRIKPAKPSNDHVVEKPINLKTKKIGRGMFRR